MSDEKTPPFAKKCSNCKGSRLVVGPDGKINFGGLLECRMGLKQATAVLIPLGPGKAEVQFISCWPSVKPDEECEMWKPRLSPFDILSKEPRAPK